jgi:peptidoglycan hydrolase CwlO-like protein
MGPSEIDRRSAAVIIAPIVVVGVACVGLFWQQGQYLSNFSQNYLSLREHAEYENSTRRELDSAKSAADAQINALQRQLDTITTQLRLQLEEKIKDLQSQIDSMRKSLDERRDRK